MSCGLEGGWGVKLRCSYWLVDEGNSCDSTEDQLEADVSAARLTPAGVHVSAPLQETEGGGGWEAGAPVGGVGVVFTEHI